MIRISHANRAMRRSVCLCIWDVMYFFLIFVFVWCLCTDTDNQRIIIALKDVNDEPPYFINRPLPMQAVVQLNAPPNTPVFTLQARDPDTDANIHYFIVRDRSKYGMYERTEQR